MRILFINPGGKAQGGAERSLAELIAGLVERGHEPHVALMASGDASSLFRDAGAQIAGVVADELQVAPRHEGLATFAAGALASAPRVFDIAKSLRRIVNRTRPDVIHSNGFRSHLLTPALRTRSIPVVWSLRDRAPRSLHRRLLGAASRSADAIIANSTFTAEQMSHHSMHVVANPITPPRSIERDKARTVLGLPTDRHVVAIAAHLHPSKGHDVMVSALANWEQHSRPTLAIAGGRLYRGSAEYADELEAMIEANGLAENVRFLGNVDDVAPVYAAADVVVHPCRHPEGFGRVVVEAQSTGTPVVATDLGGVKDLVADSETGLLVEPDDSDAMFRAVDSVLFDSPVRSLLIERGRLAAARFGRTQHTDAVESIYAELTGLATGSKPARSEPRESVEALPIGASGAATEVSDEASLPR